MPTFYFERECRTPYSECYTVIEEDQPVGRLDLHFAAMEVHATLCVAESLTQENIQELVDMVDEELVDAVGVGREELIVHVHQGQDLGVFSNHEYGRDGGEPR